MRHRPDACVLETGCRLTLEARQQPAPRILGPVGWRAGHTGLDCIRPDLGLLISAARLFL